MGTRIRLATLPEIPFQARTASGCQPVPGTHSATSATPS